MFLVDLKQKRVVKDEEVKQKLAATHEYGSWLTEQQITWEHLNALPTVRFARCTVVSDYLFFAQKSIKVDDKILADDPRVHMFGYGLESVHMLLTPMLDEGEESLGSMGNDAALACMSRQPRVIYDYFKQLFAQV